MCILHAINNIVTESVKELSKNIMVWMCMYGSVWGRNVDWNMICWILFYDILIVPFVDAINCVV